MRLPIDSRDRIVQRLMSAAERLKSPALRKAKLEAAARRAHILQSRAEAIGFGAWPSMPTRSDGIDVGVIPFGTIPHGIPFWAPADTLCGLSLIVGRPGVGKTTQMSLGAEAAAAQGVWTCWIDSKNAPNSSSGLSFPLLDPAQASMSLLHPPGIGAQAWMGCIRWILEHTLYISEGSQLLPVALERLLSVVPPGREPCLADLLHVLTAWPWPRAAWREEQLRSTAKGVLDRLVTGEHQLFTTTKMIPWERRLRVPHGVFLNGVPPDSARVYTLLILLAYLTFEQSRQVNDRRLQGLVLIDDCRWIVRDLKRTGVSGTDPLQYTLDLCNSRGLGVVLNVQNFAEIGEALIRAATLLVLAGPLHGDDVRQVRTHLQLNDAQCDYLIHQPPHTAVIWSSKLGFTYPFPVLMPRPELLPAPDQAQRVRDERMRVLLDGHAASPWAPLDHLAGSPAPHGRAAQVPPAPNGAPPASSLDPSGLKALRVLAEEPWLYQDEIAHRLRVRGRIITGLRDRLAQAGVIRAHSVARYVVWELTAQGANAIGMSYQPPKGKGGFGHLWLQCRGVAFLNRSCRQVQIEKVVGGGPRRVDVYGETPDGSLIAYEIMLGLDNLPETLDKLTALAATSTIVVENSRAAAEVRSAVDARCGLGVPKPAVITVREFVQQTRA